MAETLAYMEKLLQETNKPEAELMTLAFQTGIRQLWRQHVLGRYLRAEITRNEAINNVGIDLVELSERQHKAMMEDLAWAMEQ